MMNQSKLHWEQIYTTKSAEEVSWTQEFPGDSIAFFESFKLPLDAEIIDIGGGDSRFVDYLIEKGYRKISLLDISAAAIERAKLRLGEKSKMVTWIVSDINDFVPTKVYDFWHDRAAFHFLTQAQNIEQYGQMLNAFAKNLVLATFSPQGPKKCSGLDVCQYDENSMKSFLLNHHFKNIECKRVDHITPTKAIQNFMFCSFYKVA